MVNNITKIVDKNGKIINNGDRVIVRANLARYPGMYHYGIYNVRFDEVYGLELLFEDLVTKENDTMNQTIGTNILRINKHIELWRCDSDIANSIEYCRFNIKEGTTFVNMESTSDIEKIID